MKRSYHGTSTHGMLRKIKPIGTTRRINEANGDEKSIKNIEKTLKHLEIGCYAMLVLLFAIVVCVAIIVKPAYDTLVETSEAEAAILSIITNNTETVVNIIHSVNDVVDNSRRLLPETVSEISSVVNLLLEKLNATDDDDYYVSNP